MLFWKPCIWFSKQNFIFGAIWAILFLRLLLAYYRLLAIVNVLRFWPKFFRKIMHLMQSEFIVVCSNFWVWDKKTFLGHLKSAPTWRQPSFALNSLSLESVSIQAIIWLSKDVLILTPTQYWVLNPIWIAFSMLFS